MSKTAIVILSDPKGGAEEALGRVFNALAAAYDFKAANQEVKIIFQGTGTRWPAVLQDAAYPANELYLAVADKVAGVSGGCAVVFDADPSGLELIKDNAVPGTAGLPSFVNLQQEGFHALIF